MSMVKSWHVSPLPINVGKWSLRARNRDGFISSWWWLEGVRFKTLRFEEILCKPENHLGFMIPKLTTNLYSCSFKFAEGWNHQLVSNTSFSPKWWLWMLLNLEVMFFSDENPMGFIAIKAQANLGIVGRRCSPLWNLTNRLNRRGFL